MAYYEIDIILDKDGNTLLQVLVPLKFILPTMKYRYSLNHRKLILSIVQAYFSKEVIDDLKSHASELFKSKFGESRKVSSLKLIDANISGEYVLLKFLVRFGNIKRQNMDKTI